MNVIGSITFSEWKGHGVLVSVGFESFGFK